MNAPAAQLNALRGVSAPAPTKVYSEQDKKKEVIKKGLDKAFSGISGEEKEIVAQRLMDTQNKNEKIKIGGTEVSFDDLAVSVARSIQTMESETSPQEEYYRWIYEAQDVITKMTDGDITDSDIELRENFLGDLDQRETDMRVCISLYASRPDNPYAKEQLAFLQVKLAKLMEIRSAIKVSTKSKEEALAERANDEKDKERGHTYCEFLRRRAYGDRSIFSDDEYKLGVCCAQAVIALSLREHLTEAEKRERNRYARYLEQRMRDLIYQRDLALKNKNDSFENAERLTEIQKRMAAHQEIMNLVKVATTPSKQVNANAESQEEDKIRREMCSLVLECRRRGQEVPDRFLYRLGVKSFVPDYSASEEHLVDKTRTKADVIKRINELSGRQSAVSRPKSEIIQRFNSQHFMLLQQKMREAKGLS